MIYFSNKNNMILQILAHYMKWRKSSFEVFFDGETSIA